MDFQTFAVRRKVKLYGLLAICLGKQLGIIRNDVPFFKVQPAFGLKGNSGKFSGAFGVIKVERQNL